MHDAKKSQMRKKYLTYTCPILLRVSTKDTIIGFNQNYCRSFIVTAAVKILGTPAISRRPVTKIPFTFLSQPFFQLFYQGNLSFQNTGRRV